MTSTHSELMQELLPLYDKDPNRFMRFYNAIYLMLLNIPEGGALIIAEHCSKAAIGMFIKVASLLIIEDTCSKSVTDDLLEFSDDYTMIRRSYKFIPSRSFSRRKRL